MECGVGAKKLGHYFYLTVFVDSSLMRDFTQHNTHKPVSHKE
jgi:hypothetical protein